MSTTFGPPVVLAGPLPSPLPARAVQRRHDRPRAGRAVGQRRERAGLPERRAVRVRPLLRRHVPREGDPRSAGAPFFGGFTVYLADRCAARGIGTDAALDDRVRLAFQAVEQWAVEQELVSGGVMAANPYLADGNATQLLSGAATAPAEALAQLEAAIGDSRQGRDHPRRAGRPPRPGRASAGCESSGRQAPDVPRALPSPPGAATRTRCPTERAHSRTIRSGLGDRPGRDPPRRCSTCSPARSRRPSTERRTNSPTAPSGTTSSLGIRSYRLPSSWIGRYDHE